jgi:hypothetical protein
MSVTLEFHNPNRRFHDSLYDGSRWCVGPLDVPEGWRPLAEVAVPHPSHPMISEVYDLAGRTRRPSVVRYEFRAARKRRAGDPIRL